MPYNYFPKYTETEKPCLQCGKMHRRKKFCSPSCGSRYNNKKSNDPQFKPSKISSIIRQESGGISDSSYAFVFSNRIEDWCGSKSKIRHDLWRANAKGYRDN